MRASSAAPLIALDVVVMDTETTGLDVRQDRIVQIGALRMRGGDILDGHALELVLDPGVPIPQIATRIHGLADADVSGKPGFASAVRDLRDFIGDSVVVGHSIHFDLALLRHEARRHGVQWEEPRALDIALMAAGLDRELVDTSLDSLALAHGIAISGRHTALGDAMATARVYAAMLPPLMAQGVRTLGEAEAVSRRAGDLIARQEHAGWYDRPGERPSLAQSALEAGGQRAIDSFLYRQRLGDVMTHPVLTVAADARLHDAAALMHEKGVGCLFVHAGDETGIVTERDVLRLFALKGGAAASVPVGEVMSAPVIAAPADTFLYRALGLMARRNLRYMGVTDAGGRVTGLFTLRTLLRERALATLTVGDEIAVAGTAGELARVQAALPDLAGGLLADGLEARAVAAVIAAEGRAMTARAAEIAEAELVAEGAGPAPADYALLVLGSGGRGESLLAPDQDNALVIADSYAGDLDAPGDWFTRFAMRFTEILDQAGIPLCKGGVMARNRPWRRRLSEWRTQLEAWSHKPEPQALLNVDIFYDFAPAHVSAHGAALAEALRASATEIARASPGMLRTMGELAGSHAAPLGFFGRIRKDDAGRVDLKSGALLPITAGARVIAMRHGIAALSTPERFLQAARASGRSETDAAMMAEAHGLILRLVLTQQIADIAAGIRPGNRVDVAALGRLDRDHLREALGRIDTIREMLRDMLAGI
ncbi:MAG: DUF294 nucleotidyltransferase-like domain-containing protein [Alphaproteobacteria bacterium]|nr:DUF294 nucleotidyltransferase-like domain-containing protein [Alphaproteobacteria bacterium]MDX5369833.1 DUF294 nucleotidyltransferase-like domain-containing protein [Alphaproteobacteria bacterium]MDX5464449.1 DUF294 nucleotidyltransferase-like domain-containing protein [Alphaproteobacteria bacterium]